VLHEITVVGTGYVGLVTGACFAELGNRVVCVDIDSDRIQTLNAGRLPFFEPGLEELVARNAAAGRLIFETDPARAIVRASIIFLAVGTPQGSDGDPDLTQVREAALTIAQHLGRDTIVVNKSTVPVETGDFVSALIRECKVAPYEVSVVSNPEFLREGSAINDFMNPDRIVLGSDQPEALAIMRRLYAPLDASVIETDIRTAEMIKYTANAFLATKISFANEVALICERVGANVSDVMRAAGADKRIGTAFLGAGIGFGGSCFPKDVAALSKLARRVGLVPALLEATLSANARQIEHAVGRIVEYLGRDIRGALIGVLGLAFKPQTDDIRESPAIALIEGLIARGAQISAHDPVAIPVARRRLGERIAYAASPYDAAAGADALVIATDWNEYKQLDLERVSQAMRGRLLFDGRNIFNGDEAASLGFDYVGVGQPFKAPNLGTLTALA
jgi:UDPglucose 6-dehydrogenase